MGNTIVQMGKNFIQNPAGFVSYGLNASAKGIKSQASKVDKSIREAVGFDKNENYDANRLSEDTYERASTSQRMMEETKQQNWISQNKHLAQPRKL